MYGCMNEQMNRSVSKKAKNTFASDQVFTLSSTSTHNPTSHSSIPTSPVTGLISGCVSGRVSLCGMHQSHGSQTKNSFLSPKFRIPRNRRNSSSSRGPAPHFLEGKVRLFVLHWASDLFNYNYSLNICATLLEQQTLLPPTPYCFLPAGDYYQFSHLFCTPCP